MESLRNYWSELMEIPEAKWVVLVAGLAICICAGFYVVKLFRDMAMGNRSDPTSYITDFQKLRDEGKLNDEEYSRLKQSIPKQLPKELAGKETEIVKKAPLTLEAALKMKAEQEKETQAGNKETDS